MGTKAIIGIFVLRLAEVGKLRGTNSHVTALEECLTNKPCPTEFVGPVDTDRAVVAVLGLCQWLFQNVEHFARGRGFLSLFTRAGKRQANLWRLRARVITAQCLRVTLPVMSANARFTKPGFALARQLAMDRSSLLAYNCAGLFFHAIQCPAVKGIGLDSRYSGPIEFQQHRTSFGPNQ